MFLLSGILGGEENYYSKISGCFDVFREQQGATVFRVNAGLLKYLHSSKQTAPATWICYIVRATSPFGVFP